MSDWHDYVQLYHVMHNANSSSQTIVDEFNSNPSAFVFLISTKAGGLGLNITSANKVVIVDPNWNPAYDLQAQDRAYRLGQTRDVEVFRLISAGTIEEVVYARQIYKQQQANIGYNASVERRYFKGVQDQKELKGEIFGLANLFAPTSEEIKLRDIFNKTNIAESRAGVEIAGLDLEVSRNEDDDDVYDGNEETALSQLAQEIIDEPGTRRKKAGEGTKKPDGVMAILASAGVKRSSAPAKSKPASPLVPPRPEATPTGTASVHSSRARHRRTILVTLPFTRTQDLTNLTMTRKALGRRPRLGTGTSLRRKCASASSAPWRRPPVSIT
jgi:hypothetical protein